MQVDRAALIQHLTKISCGGRVQGAVFTDAFQTSALTQDQLLFVYAPALPNTHPLGQPLTGVADIELLIKALNALAGAGNESTVVTVELENHRLVLNEAHRGMIRLITANPSTVGTYVSPEVVQKLLVAVADTEGMPLTRNLIEGVTVTFNLLKAKEVELVFGPMGGKIRVGHDNAHDAVIPTPALTHPEPFTLLFGEHLVEVLTVITDYSHAKLVWSGPNSLIAIHDGAYRYVLSPRAKPADETQVRTPGAVAPEPVPVPA